MITVQMMAAFIAGMAIGLFFFGSLWWVVSRVQRTERPEYWIVVSFFVRSAIALSGFYLVSSGRFERLVACILGFLLMRFIIVRVVVRSAKKTNRSDRGAISDLDRRPRRAIVRKV